MGTTLLRLFHAAVRPRTTVALLVLAAVLWAGPAPASPVDSWGGQIFLEDPTDVFAYPHRALDYPGTATLVYVPPTSNAGDFSRAPLSNTQVAGVLTFGKGSWMGIIGANVPNSFNPLEAYGSGNARGWGGGLEFGQQHHSHLVLGIDSSYSPEVTAKMQLGGAFQATDDLRAGVTFQQFGQTWTEDATFGMNPSEKTGFDISGYNVTGSGAFGGLSVIPELEGAFSYGTSDQEEWNPVDGIGGSGSANTFSVAAGADLGDFGWIASREGLRYRLYGRYDRTTSDFTNEAANDSTPGAKDDCETTSFDLRWGVSTSGDVLFAASAGFQMRSEEDHFESSSGATSLIKVEEKFMPFCDAGGEVPLGHGFVFDYGMMAMWRDVEITNTAKDPNGDVVVRTVEKDENVETSYHVGLGWIPRDNFRLSLTLDTDQLGDPGGVVFGNSNDAPGIAVGARYSF
ncbi:hypothetical protein K8I85_03695 [bacterium]|nr:hypothetical protein [bacterium]